MNEGNRIKEIRLALNLTLEQFGVKVGVTKAAMSNIENGNRNVTEQMRKAICREFNVNYSYLLHGEGKMFSELPQTVLDELCRQYDCDSLDRTIIKYYLALSTEERLAVRRHILNLANSLNADSKTHESNVEEMGRSTDVMDAEMAYIKSRSISAQNMDLNASSTINAKKDEKAVG